MSKILITALLALTWIGGYRLYKENYRLRSELESLQHQKRFHSEEVKAILKHTDSVVEMWADRMAEKHLEPEVVRSKLSNLSDSGCLKLFFGKSEPNDLLSCGPLYYVFAAPNDSELLLETLAAHELLGLREKLTTAAFGKSAF